MDIWMFVLTLLLKFFVIYLLIGLILNLFIFLFAKMKSLDERYVGWQDILNSVTGFLYFMFNGCLYWMPVFISFFRGRKSEEQEVEEDPETSWWWNVKNPYKSLKNWFQN
jgi:hypothetical protein